MIQGKSYMPPHSDGKPVDLNELTAGLKVSGDDVSDLTWETAAITYKTCNYLEQTKGKEAVDEYLRGLLFCFKLTYTEKFGQTSDEDATITVTEEEV